jgi:hypothetical protein
MTTVPQLTRCTLCGEGFETETMFRVSLMALLALDEPCAKVLSAELKDWLKQDK